MPSGPSRRITGIMPAAGTCPSPKMTESPDPFAGCSVIHSNKVLAVNPRFGLILCAFFIAICILLSGCSSSIYSSGKHKMILKRGTARSAVVAELGPPLESIESDIAFVVPSSKQSPGSGQPKRGRLDTYCTREIIPDWMNATYAGMIGAMTRGVSGLFMIPYALGHFVPRQKRLTLNYDENDRLGLYFLENSAATP